MGKGTSDLESAAIIGVVFLGLMVISGISGFFSGLIDAPKQFLTGLGDTITRAMGGIPVHDPRAIAPMMNYAKTGDKSQLLEVIKSIDDPNDKARVEELYNQLPYGTPNQIMNGVLAESAYLKELAMQMIKSGVPIPEVAARIQVMYDQWVAGFSEYDFRVLDEEGRPISKELLTRELVSV